jgi:tyrosyl-tRNA synthetase
MYCNKLKYFHLNKEFDCILQIGGSDQWGNIIAGIEFGEKILPNKDFFGMTSDLLVNSSGEKMGKTLSGAIWLDEKLQVVDFLEDVQAKTYPTVFQPKNKARYILEVNSGFVKENGIKVGDQATLLK